MSIRQLLGSGDTSSLPLSYLVEALSAHDAQLLDELQLLIERKRRELKAERKTAGPEDARTQSEGAAVNVCPARNRRLAHILRFDLLFLVAGGRGGVWRSLKWRRVREQTVADLLFALRVVPLLASIVVTPLLLCHHFRFWSLARLTKAWEHCRLPWVCRAITRLWCFRGIAAQSEDISNRGSMA